MKIILVGSIIILAATMAFAADIIPVSVWPRVIYLPGKQVINPTVSQCVEAGYRMIPARPATPEGKQVKSERFVQDTKNSAYCIYEIIYEDIPPPLPPENIVEVAADKVVFQFTDGGEFRAVRLK